MPKTTTFLYLFILAASAGAATIFDDDFNDSTGASQAGLVAAVGTGTWIVTDVDTSTIPTGASRYLNLSRGDYDYIAVFSQPGSAADGGTITMDLSFLDSVHDYNTISIREGGTELFRIEVQTDDGGTGGTDAQINLVGATTQTLPAAIRETAEPNRSFQFMLNAAGVDLSITGEGLASALTASVDYANAPSVGPDRIRFYKNDAVGNPDRGQLRVDNILADFTPVTRTVLVDFDDGNAGNGIHVAAVRDGDFSGQAEGSTIQLPWQSLSSGQQFADALPAGVGSDRNAVMVGTRVYALDAAHTLALGDVFNLEYSWRDAAGWDPADSVEMVLYYTDTDVIGGAPVNVFTLNSGGRNTTVTWEGEAGTSAPFANGSGVGKKLFLKLQANSAAGEFARMDNIFLEVASRTGDHQPATIIQGEVAITGWTGATHHDFWTEGNANGQGSVSNSLAETDSDGYGNTTPPFDDSGNQVYDVTWADGEAGSYRGDFLSAFNIYVNGTASANLDLDLTGAPAGSRAEGLVSAGFGGYTFDASDGNANGLINFDVNFTIDVTVDGSGVNGLHGVFVDAYSTDFSTATDLVTVGTPTVYSTYYDDTFDMVYSEIADSGDFAWFFAYADELVAAEPGGTISDTLTASFVFVPTTDLSTIFDYVEIAAFALAEASVVPASRPRLLHFTYDPRDGSSEVTIDGEPDTAYRLVEASRPEFNAPIQDPVSLDGATEGSVNGDIVTTDGVTSKARVQFNLGTNKTRTYLRARRN